MMTSLIQSLKRISESVATDDSEFEQKHPRAKGGLFAKKGTATGGGSENRVSGGGISSDSLKSRQFEVIRKSNPAQDNSHAWIRSVADIKTAKEAFEEDGALESGFAPDAGPSVYRNALKTGQIKVFSSKPIQNGNFVTPSRMEAANYAGGGKVYEATLPLDSIAWLDAGQGQVANVGSASSGPQSSASAQGNRSLFAKKGSASVSGSGDECFQSVRRTESGYSVEVGGKSVGFMSLTRGYGDSIANEIAESTGEYNLRGIDPNAKSVYVEDLGVSRNHRGKGYAKQMMDNLLKDQGDKQLVLRAFDPGGESEQDRLVEFYKGYGFRPIAETESEGVVMVRSPGALNSSVGGNGEDSIPLTLRFAAADQDDDIIARVAKKIALDSRIPRHKKWYKEHIARFRVDENDEKGKSDEDDDKPTLTTRARAHEREAGGEEGLAKVESISPEISDFEDVKLGSKEIRSIIRENCDLIKTVDKDMIPGIERRVKRIYEGTSTPETLTRYLENECDLEPYQAERIVKDQMQKYEAMTRLEQMKKNGVKLVRWVHGGSKEPRPWHMARAPYGLNGKVFDIDNPPVIDPETGERGWPGQLIGCHCHLEVVE